MYNNDFKERFKDLIEENPTENNIRLKPIEERGDDCGTSLLKSFKGTDTELTELAKKTAPNGFIETYCLSDIDRKKIKKIRESMNEKNKTKTLKK